MFMGPCILVYNDHINNGRDAAVYVLYLMVMLYMFRMSLAHHQEFKETVFAVRCRIQLFLILSFVCHVLYLCKIPGCKHSFLELLMMSE